MTYGTISQHCSTCDTHREHTVHSFHTHQATGFNLTCMHCLSISSVGETTWDEMRAQLKRAREQRYVPLQAVDFLPLNIEEIPETITTERIGNGYRDCPICDALTHHTLSRYVTRFDVTTQWHCSVCKQNHSPHGWTWPQLAEDVTAQPWTGTMPAMIRELAGVD